MTLSGNPYRSCDLNIKSTHIIRTSFSIISSNATATGMEYIYFERLGPVDTFSHRYVVVKHPLQTCDLYFCHDNIHLHFGGDLTVIINSSKAIEADGSVIQTEEINQEVMVGQTSDCQEIEGYDSVIQCTRELKPSWGPNQLVTMCNAQCPHNCSCILSDREVMYNCSTRYNQPPNKRAFLLLSTNISHLDMTGTGLTVLMPDSFETIGRFITHLYLRLNFLVSLPASLFRSLLHLTTLSLEHNYLASMPAGLFSGLQNLTVLDISYNFLVLLPVELFNGLYSLDYLLLQDNSLISLPDGLFNDLHNLTVLWLAYNSLTLLPAGLFYQCNHLLHLYLNDNSLVSLPAWLFNGLYTLKLLDLAKNSLVLLPTELFHGLHSLQFLYLRRNSLKKLPAGLFNGLHRLYSLYLSHNSLMSLTPKLLYGMHTLKTLYLYDNNLVSLPTDLFNNMYELERIVLDNNYLVSLPAGVFTTTPNLTTLSVENNTITHITHGTFSNLTALIYLYLANNKLSFLSFDLFDDLINLDRLDLSNNALTHIPRLGHMTKLSLIAVVGNALTGITSEIFNGVPETADIVVDQAVVCVCYMNRSESCFNTKKQSPYLTCGWLLSLSVLSIFTWILGLCATLGNGFVLLWRQFKHGGHGPNRVQSLLLSNLALSDLLMGIYLIIISSADAYYGEYFPMNAEEWRTGFICRIASTLAITSSEASVFFVTLISIDRFINIKFPYTIYKLRIKSTRWASSVVWCVSLTLGLTASILAGRNPKFYDNSHICIGLPLARLVNYDTNPVSLGVVDYTTLKHITFDKVTNETRSPGLYFSVAIFIGLNMLCFLLILACYISIIKTVSQTSKEASRQREMAEEIRMTIKVSAIVLTDFCCWFPICLIGALVQVGIMTIPPDIFAWVVTFVLPINSAINPFMYTIGTLIGDKCLKKQSYTHSVQMHTLSTSQPDKI